MMQLIIGYYIAVGAGVLTAAGGFLYLLIDELLLIKNGGK